jgi:hypothetical protein
MFIDLLQYIFLAIGIFFAIVLFFFLLYISARIFGKGVIRSIIETVEQNKKKKGV